LAHVLIGKPVSTLPEHALDVPTVGLRGLRRRSPVREPDGRT